MNIGNMVLMGNLRDIPNLELVRTYSVDGLDYRDDRYAYPNRGYRSRYGTIEDPLVSHEFDRYPVSGIYPDGDGLRVELTRYFYDAETRTWRDALA